VVGPFGLSGGAAPWDPDSVFKGGALLSAHSMNAPVAGGTMCRRVPPGERIAALKAWAPG
jgi:hypothetical protein